MSLCLLPNSILERLRTKEEAQDMWVMLQEWGLWMWERFKLSDNSEMEDSPNVQIKPQVKIVHHAAGSQWHWLAGDKSGST